MTKGGCGFTEAQMVAILREADKGPVAEVAKKHGISEQTIYTWRKRFGAMGANEVKRLRMLEQENTRLKKILAVTCPVQRLPATALLHLLEMANENGPRLRAISFDAREETTSCCDDAMPRYQEG